MTATTFATMAAPTKPECECGAEHALQTSVEQLGQLTTYVDRLSAESPLADFPSLRAQMRRSAIDALTHMACALEAAGFADFRRLALRSLTALAELDTFGRMAHVSGALTPSEAGRLELLVAQAGRALRLALAAAAEANPACESEREPAPPLALSGAA